ncbi:MAG: ankyrin repeat domain-containing protein [Legionellales bacterium]|nr:ankyrin repeat domain-containing protein [Legionellales bacterium]
MATSKLTLNFSENETQQKIDHPDLTLDLKLDKQKDDELAKTSPKNKHLFAPQGAATTPRESRKRASLGHTPRQSSLRNLLGNQILRSPRFEENSSHQNIKNLMSATKENVNLGIEMLLAALEEDWVSVKEYVDQGAYIDSYLTKKICEQNNQPQTYSGYTILHFAIWHTKDQFVLKNKEQIAKIDLIKYLVDKDANVNSSTAKYTPLHIAALKGNLEIFQFLLEKGANPNARSKDDLTALQIASEKALEFKDSKHTRNQTGHADIVRELQNIKPAPKAKQKTSSSFFQIFKNPWKKSKSNSADTMDTKTPQRVL